MDRQKYLRSSISLSRRYTSYYKPSDYGIERNSRHECFVSYYLLRVADFR
jgi:hypothetical protein